MPNRILRSSILDSAAVDQLDELAEVFYRRLMSVVDDFGRYDARPSVLKAACYPLRLDRVREADISRWTAICEKAGLIALYEVDGKSFLVLHKLGTARAKTSKFPDPPSSIGMQMRADARTCAQMRPYSDSDSDSYSGSNVSLSPHADAREAENPAAIPGVQVTDDHRSQAIQGFDQWSKFSRQHELMAEHNEHRAVFDLLDVLAQEPPVIDGTRTIGQHLLVAQACGLLQKKRTDFKRIKWAIGCVKNQLDDWQRHGLPGAAAAKDTPEAQAKRVAELIRQREAARSAKGTVSK